MPLSQILNDGTASYIYGLDRLTSSDGTWYLGDALGSLRQTLDASGAVLATASYDPWGVPQPPAVPPQAGGSPQISPFGFTGELQHGNAVYLTARWYDAQAGRFGSRDAFAGFPEQPYSLHPYQYAYANPVLWTDPSGTCVDAHGNVVPCPSPVPNPGPLPDSPEEQRRRNSGYEPFLWYQSSDRGYSGNLLLYLGAQMLRTWQVVSGSAGNTDAPPIPEGMWWVKVHDRRNAWDPRRAICTQIPDDWPGHCEPYGNPDAWGESRIPLAYEDGRGSDYFLHGGNPDRGTNGCIKFINTKIDDVFKDLEYYGEPLLLVVPSGYRGQVQLPARYPVFRGGDIPPWLRPSEPRPTPSPAPTPAHAPPTP